MRRGDSVVVWTDGDTVALPGLDGSSFGVFGQRYDSDGNPVGGEFLVNSDTLGIQDSPEVAIDPDGNFVVVWEDSATFGGDGDGNSSGIAGQRFDSDGNPVGAQFQVNELTAGMQRFPSIGFVPDGGFVVAWNTPVGFDWDLKARRFDSDGAPLASEFQVNEVTDRYLHSEIGVANNGEFVVTWNSGPYTASFRRFDSDGTPLSNENRFASSNSAPALDMMANGGFVLARTDENYAPVAQRFGPDNLPVGPEIALAEGFSGAPDVVVDPNGNFIAAWHRSGIRARQFDTAGNPVGAELLVNSSASGSQGNPRFGMDAQGNFTVVWQDGGEFSNGQDGDRGGVFGRRFEPGTPPIDPALAGHWPLDEGAGVSAVNSAGNGLDGVLEGGVAWVPGQQASATRLNGSDGLIRVADSPDSSIDSTEALTLALWVLPESTAGSHQVLVSKDDAYELEFGKLGPTTWDLRLDNTTVHTASTDLEQGIWQHLAMTWDGTEVCSYYNGLLDSCSLFATTLSPNDNDLGLGARPSLPANGGPVFHFQGALDEVYVYNRALEATEIAELVLEELTDLVPPGRTNLAPAVSLPPGSTVATLSLDTDEDAACRYDTSAGVSFELMSTVFTTTGGSSHTGDLAVIDDGLYRLYVRCRDGLGNTNSDDVVISFGVGAVDLCLDLAADWRLDEGSGCFAADGTGSNTGALGPSCSSNAPAWVAGREGSNGALAYDGDDDEVRIANPLGVSPLSAVTLAAWIQHDLAGNWRAILDRREGNDDGYALYITNTSRPYARANGSTLTGNTVVADGQWHHVAGVYDGSTLRLYVDGQLDSSTAASAGTLDVSAPLFLGRRWENTQTPFAGTIDEASIHGRALSAVEILDLYNAGIPACGP